MALGRKEVFPFVECFCRSLDQYNLRYTKYIGDGDTKSYQKVVAADPYSGVQIDKLECIGHVQKRVDSRLRKLKQTTKTKLSDEKILGGKGRLTDNMINKLQYY